MIRSLRWFAQTLLLGAVCACEATILPGLPTAEPDPFRADGGAAIGTDTGVPYPVDGGGGADPLGAPDAAGPTPAAFVLWHDSIQAGAAPWGFDGLGIEHPIGQTVVPSDANGVNLSRVVDPLGGRTFALRHYATFDDGGSRSQAGIYSFANATFSRQAKSPEGVWVAQEWFFPQALSASGDNRDWMNLWDWHSTDPGGGNRWHTSPGLMLAEDGSMRVKWEWGGPGKPFNRDTALSTLSLPVGRWFDVEMHYVWSSDGTTLSLWVDGRLALEQTGAQTRAPSHQVVETYMKFYGSRNGGSPWTPAMSVRYTRNVRVGAQRIWR
jgi:hypothetical protein